MSTLAELPSDELVAAVIAAVWLANLFMLVVFLLRPSTPKVARSHLRWELVRRAGSWLKARARSLS